MKKKSNIYRLCSKIKFNVCLKRQDENMEKLAENDEEILYVNKNNPFGVERMKEITKSLKGILEVDDDNEKNFTGHFIRENKTKTFFRRKST